MKRYLGDSVYAEYDGFNIVLTTENGMGPSNIICLEPSVLVALDEFKQAIKLTLAARAFKQSLAEPVD